MKKELNAILGGFAVLLGTLVGLAGLFGMFGVVLSFMDLGLNGFAQMLLSLGSMVGILVGLVLLLWGVKTLYTTSGMFKTVAMVLAGAVYVLAGLPLVLTLAIASISFWAGLLVVLLGLGMIQVGLNMTIHKMLNEPLKQLYGVAKMLPF